MAQRKAALLPVVCLLALMLACFHARTGGSIAWQQPVSRARHSTVARHAAEKEPPAATKEVPTEPAGIPSEPTSVDEADGRINGLQRGMYSRLRDEAGSWGDENTPITAGFGNPFLLAIVVFGVLGVGSYYSLGLDKVAKQKPVSEAQMIKNYQKMQDDMYGTMR